MFTGIIQAIGEIAALQPGGEDTRVRVRTGKLALDDVSPGDSIAVNGVCLTVVELPGDGFWADVSGETLARTGFRDLTVGSRVNLEQALTPTTRLGGHLVSGHVDGVGTVLERRSEGRSERFRIQAPAGLAKYIAEKGSICVDGVSLTVNAVEGAAFDLNIVPHTLQGDHHRRVPQRYPGEPGGGHHRPLSGAAVAGRAGGRAGQRDQRCLSGRAWIYQMTFSVIAALSIAMSGKD